MIKYLWFKMIRKIGGAAIRNSVIGYDSKIEAGSVFINSKMGKHSFCGYDCFINNCSIGSYVSIADRVYIGRGIHPVKWVSTSPVFYNNRDSVKTKYSRHEREPLPETTIGNDVWIGDCALIKAGIKIGDGAVIGMGSIVTKDVEPYTIVAGNPARLIRKRFSEDIIERLIESQWWNYDSERLSDLAPYITNPLDFLNQIKEGDHQ